MSLFGIPLANLLGLAVIGSFVTVLGSLLALFIREYYLVRSFENWKLRNSLNMIYRKYRDPILLSARELCTRLDEICEDYPSVYLSSKLLRIAPEHQVNNSQADPYFQKYKLVSTLYRFCAFLGWLELYRQDITYLDSGQNRTNKKLDECLHNIRADLADGQLNEAQDWQIWRDVLIFREEQRAIGEAMIRGNGEPRTVVGYGAFCRSLDNKDQDDLSRWIKVVSNFLLDLTEDKKDYRRVRLQRLIVHLIDLMESLDQKRLPASFIERRLFWHQKLGIEKAL